MTKRYLLILFCFLAWGSLAWAQSSMTDEEIIQYVQTAYKRGKSPEQIALELQQKGISTARLQHIKEKYERQGQKVIQTEGESGKTQTGTNTRMRQGQGYQQQTSRDTERQKREMSGMLDNWIADTLVTDDLYLDDLLPETDTKRVFGRDIFNAERLSFEPNMNIATPANYRLGAGDDIYIDVWGASQKTIQETISPDGTIQIEGLGPVSLAGMTVASANAYLQREMKRIYDASSIRVTVGQTKTISVNVMGEVVAPGTYTLSAFATAFHALYVAGGVNDIGTLRDIKIYRNNRLVTAVDVYEYILNGLQDNDIRLEDNDLIYVGPYTSLVDITGKVKRPMMYEMRQSESLATLLQFAGGFSSDAYRGSVRVVRKTGRNYSVHTVDEFDMSAFQMLDGDSVSIDPFVPRYTNMVEVRGAVFRPGMYQMDGKIKTIRELLAHIGGVTEEAFLQRALLHRRRADRSLEALSIDLGGILDGAVADVPLRNEDVLIVFSSEEAHNEQTMTIHGEVRYPGVYPFARNTTIEDLILQAGGLTEAASNARIDVARRIRNMGAVTSDKIVSRTFTFSLREGLLVGGDSLFSLEPFDEVYVRRSPSYHVQQNVTIEGEVVFTGNYVLTQKTDRLSDLIQRAGGFTQDAYIPGARLERKMTEEELTRRAATLKLTQGSDSINVDLLDLSTTYSVGIELEKAMANPGGEADILLREGDRLLIPGVQTTVKINGAVMFPNSVAWKENAKLKYYINMAGGYAERAKRRSAIIVNINGTVAKAGDVKKIMPGSEIIVPLKEEKRRMTAAEIGVIGTSTASLATMIATIVSLFNNK